MASPKKKPVLVGRSPLRAVVLAVVLEQPGSHGYQIASYLRWRVGPSWRICAKHIYPVLDTLEEQGLVWSEDTPEKARSNRRQSEKDRKVYHPTEAAAQERAEWIGAPISLGLIRPDIHARLIFSHPDEAPLLLELLDECEQELIEALEANARAKAAAVSWQGRMISQTRAALGRQFDAEKESISEIRADIEKHIEESR